MDSDSQISDELRDQLDAYNVANCEDRSFTEYLIDSPKNLRSTWRRFNFFDFFMSNKF